MIKELIFSIIKKKNSGWIYETTKHDLWISLFLTRPTSRSQVLKLVLLDAFKVVFFWFWLSRDILSQWIFNTGPWIHEETIILILIYKYKPTFSCIDPFQKIGPDRTYHTVRSKSDDSKCTKIVWSDPLASNLSDR